MNSGDKCLWFSPYRFDFGLLTELIINYNHFKGELKMHVTCTENKHNFIGIKTNNTIT